MNQKISKEQNEYLEQFSYVELAFGSRLHGNHNENSDYDYVRIITDSSFEKHYSYENYVCRFLPNTHSFQFDNVEENVQLIWMTERQFFANLFSGDGNMLADIVLLNEDFLKYYPELDPLHICRTYKIIKGYLGVARRDMKLHGNVEKKRFHALRSLCFAEKLLNNQLPTVRDIIKLKNLDHLPDSSALLTREKELRSIASEMLNSGKLDLYPTFKEENEILQMQINSNNIREFKYN